MRLAILGAAGAAAFFSGLWFGRMWGESAAQARIIQAQEQTRATAENASRIIEARTNERNQCWEEIEKVNLANQALTSELNQALAEDRVRRDAALERIREASEAAAASSQRLEAQTQEARKIIAEVSDACVRAGVPADVVGMLNAIAPSAPD